MARHLKLFQYTVRCASRFCDWTLLFLIYMVMSVPLSEGSQLTVYADHILLYRPITCKGDFSALQEDINKLDSWIEANYLQFNISKYKYMVVSRRRAGISPASLTLQGHHLKCVECFGLLPGPLMLILCSMARKLLGLLYQYADLELQILRYSNWSTGIPGASPLRICQPFHTCRKILAH